MGQVQNSQRGNIFIWFIFFLFFTIITILRFCWNKIDRPQTADGQPYKQQSNGHEGSNEQMEKSKKQQDPSAQSVQEESRVEIALKYFYQYETQIIPLIIPFALTLVLGATKAFSMIWFFIFSIVLTIFNGIKIHRRFVSYKVVWILLENIYVVLSFFWWVNFWAVTPTTDPYTLYQQP